MRTSFLVSAVLLIAGCGVLEESPDQLTRQTLELSSVNGLTTSITFEAPTQQSAAAFSSEVSRFARDFTSTLGLTASLRQDGGSALWSETGNLNQGIPCLGFAFAKYANDLSPFMNVRIVGVSDNSEPGAVTQRSNVAPVPTELVGTMAEPECEFSYECGGCSAVLPSGCTLRRHCDDGSFHCVAASPVLCGGCN